ncbi:MAG: GGDEF domain-containing protein, partial [bacterium]
NHNHFMARVEEELQRARQHAVEFTIAVVELAGLAEVERALGAHARAHLVQAFTHRLQGSLRSCDVAAAIGEGRWGLLLAGVNGERAAGVADRISAEVGRDNLQVPEQYHLAVRIGLADCVEPGSSAQALIDRASMDMEIRA